MIVMNGQPKKKKTEISIVDIYKQSECDKSNAQSGLGGAVGYFKGGGERGKK